jgi:hypothetical protein
MDREEYRQKRAEDLQVEQHMLDAVAEAAKGTEWEVPNSVMVDCLVVMMCRDDDGDYCVTWMNAGSRAAAEGMANRVLRDIEFMEMTRLERNNNSD